MRSRNVAITLIVVFIILAGGIFAFYPKDTSYKPHEPDCLYGTVEIAITNITDIYAIKCPMGMYYGDTEGHFTRYGGGGISTNLAEDYVVKYMDGNELKTAIMPIAQTKVVVDNTFSVAIIRTIPGTYLSGSSLEDQKYFIDNSNHLEFSHRTWVYSEELQTYISKYYEGSTYTYEIHLPYLPETDTMSSDW